jgi:hypothetical protein
MSALRVTSQVIPAAPQLNDTRLVLIMLEAGRMSMRVESTRDESTWHSASAMTLRVRKEVTFGTAE